MFEVAFRVGGRIPVIFSSIVYWPPLETPRNLRKFRAANTAEGLKRVEFVGIQCDADVLDSYVRPRIVIDDPATAILCLGQNVFARYQSDAAQDTEEEDQLLKCL